MQSLRGNVRLRTLTTVRWLAVGGQTLAVLIVHFGLGFTTPLGLCLAAIAASAWLNVFVSLRYSPQRFLSDREAAGYIAFDITQLCALLALTGGLYNPFSALIIAPVTIAASILPRPLIGVILALTISGITVLADFHLPLPWREGQQLVPPGLYTVGVWAALTLSVVFFTAYARRIAVESAQMKSALAATQLVLEREERLAALGGLAAAAAHELGTPLATIQVTAKEMQRDLADENEHLVEDAALLVTQAQRCRDILSRLSNNSEQSDAVMDRISIEALLREAADPFLSEPMGPEIMFELAPLEGGVEAITIRRQSEVLYGLRNFIENAVEFASTKVLMSAHWDQHQLTVTIHDDGGGFSPEVLVRLGEPYVGVRQRANRARKVARKKKGMGLGFFISKTLLERTGARIHFDNRPWQEGAEFDEQSAEKTKGPDGAWVSVTWPLLVIGAKPE